MAHIAKTKGELTLDKYLIQVNYTQSGVNGLLKEGGTSRRSALTSTIESVGGSVELIYYAFGDVDAYLIADIPDEASAAALSLNINAAGAISVQMTKLITPETIDSAISKSVSYRPPGE